MKETYFMILFIEVCTSIHFIVFYCMIKPDTEQKPLSVFRRTQMVIMVNGDETKMEYIFPFNCYSIAVCRI